ncbi:MAG TPA: YraN family protein, partial [Patescibacteria group bacterium]|nr:YraN family protein [Patescibacteria group bacterium]
MILPPEARRAQGDAAEEQACRHLDRSEFTIVERNFRTRGGEIDIVARKGDLLVFVEVRS